MYKGGARLLLRLAFLGLFAASTLALDTALAGANEAVFCNENFEPKSAGLYRALSHPDGNAAKPWYGLRLDGNQLPNIMNSDEAWTFSFSDNDDYDLDVDPAPQPQGLPAPPLGDWVLPDGTKFSSPFVTLKYNADGTGKLSGRVIGGADGGTAWKPESLVACQLEFEYKAPAEQNPNNVVYSAVAKTVTTWAPDANISNGSLTCRKQDATNAVQTVLLQLWGQESNGNGRAKIFKNGSNRINRMVSGMRRYGPIGPSDANGWLITDQDPAASGPDAVDFLYVLESCDDDPDTPECPVPSQIEGKRWMVLKPRDGCIPGPSTC